jgi:hypothetical protein
LDKKVGDPHLNQWVGAVVGTYHPQIVEKHKQEDLGAGWAQHKGRPYLEIN